MPALEPTEMVTDKISLAQDIAAVGRISAVPAILKVVAELTGMRVSLVARVTADSWTACAVYDRMGFGLAVGDQLDVATTLCKEVCDLNKAIIIEHASQDAGYRNHRTPKLYQIESYIALPIVRPNGEMFGTLCAIDHNPAKLDAKVVASLELFTELIARQLADEEERRQTATDLGAERELGRLREQFIAVLGHDLRTPLGGIALTAEALLSGNLPPGQQYMVRNITESCRQMSRMISDVMDLARSRLGGGIPVDLAPGTNLTQIAVETIREQSLLHGGRPVAFSDGDPLVATADEVRFRQLVGNLVGNALQHSPASEKVVVRLDRTAGLVRLVVANGGPSVPAEMLPNLFAPFNRSQGDKPRAGLGLGLYIAAEITRAHGGSIQGESVAGSTTFTVLLPG